MDLFPYWSSVRIIVFSNVVRHGETHDIELGVSRSNWVLECDGLKMKHNQISSFASKATRENVTELIVMCGKVKT